MAGTGDCGRPAVDRARPRPGGRSSASRWSRRGGSGPGPPPRRTLRSGGTPSSMTGAEAIATRGLQILAISPDGIADRVPRRRDRRRPAGLDPGSRPAPRPPAARYRWCARPVVVAGWAAGGVHGPSGVLKMASVDGATPTVVADYAWFPAVGRPGGRTESSTRPVDSGARGRGHRECPGDRRGPDGPHQPRHHAARVRPPQPGGAPQQPGPGVLRLVRADPRQRHRDRRPRLQDRHVPDPPAWPSGTLPRHRGTCSSPGPTAPWWRYRSTRTSCRDRHRRFR